MSSGIRSTHHHTLMMEDERSRERQVDEVNYTGCIAVEVAGKKSKENRTT